MTIYFEEKNPSRKAELKEMLTAKGLWLAFDRRIWRENIASWFSRKKADRPTSTQIADINPRKSRPQL